MNWTKTPPTKPGAYWWRAESGSTKATEVFEDRDGNLIAQGFGVSDDVELLKGKWCGPLVPAEEVKAAFIEGVIQTDKNFNADACYEDSRARRVTLGEET